MENMFSVDQKVVYPSQGVGKVTEIFEKKIKDAVMLYYKIYIEASDMIVMVPVSKAPELGIRRIVNAEEAQAALNLLSDDFEPITSDWKLRYQMNLDLLKQGSVNDIAKIVRCLYNRSKVKELPILERKLYDSSKKLLIDEVSIALEKTEEEIENEIHLKLEPFGTVQKQKHIIISDDEDDDDGLMDDMSENDNGDDMDDDDDDTPKKRGSGKSSKSKSNDDDDDDDDDFGSDDEDDFDDE